MAATLTQRFLACLSRAAPLTVAGLSTVLASERAANTEAAGETPRRPYVPPQPAQWVRDFATTDGVNPLSVPSPEEAPGHLTLDTMLGEGRFERIDAFEVAAEAESGAEDGAAADGKALPSVALAYRVGKNTRGWPDIMHGGATALIIDESLGWLVHKVSAAKPRHALRQHAVTHQAAARVCRPVACVF